MSRTQISNAFFTAIKSLIGALFKICVIAIGWVLKLTGIVCTKTSEAIERIILKNS